MVRKVLAGGVFNVIHPGHCHFLRKARALGDGLVVVVASDRTVKKAGKKAFPATERAAMVASLSFVSRAVVGDEKDMSIVIGAEKPCVIAVGYDQDMEAVRLAAKRAGVKCRLVRISELPGYSTRGLRSG
ncbi:MAG: adenylyltransferase/cytidyltransferase family protein [Candidatus Aenigmatarchaeota archaeon]